MRRYIHSALREFTHRIEMKLIARILLVRHDAGNKTEALREHLLQIDGARFWNAHDQNTGSRIRPWRAVLCKADQPGSRKVGYSSDHASLSIYLLFPEVPAKRFLTFLLLVVGTVAGVSQRVRYK